jgi:hypothetical protein
MPMVFCDAYKAGNITEDFRFDVEYYYNTGTTATIKGPSTVSSKTVAKSFVSVEYYAPVQG